MKDSVYEFVKNARDEYYSQSVEDVPGYMFSQHETLRTIELYANSKFTSGPKDSLLCTLDVPGADTVYQLLPD
jgi:hypothetical protein